MRPENRILIKNEQRTHKLDQTSLSDFLSQVLCDLWEDPVELSVTLVGSRKMAELNRTWRGKQGPTDQLSFPMDEDIPGMSHLVIGDLVLCPQVISAQCVTPPPDGRPSTGTPDKELGLVLIHGLLHLAGYDHEQGGDDEQEMIGEEIRLYERFMQADRVFFK